FCVAGCLTVFYERRIWLFVAAVGLTLPALFLSPASDTVKTIGVGIGALAGLIWERQFCFSIKGSPVRKLLRLALGVALLIALRMGLKLLFPEGLMFDAIRYGLMGFVATGFWPRLFTFFKL
ncbi:membrane protein, partial [gut metagenome]